MIRRPPTLIPMTDSDVQDVRDIAARQKAELAHNKDMAEKMKKLADNPEMQKEDYLMIEQLKQAKQKEKEKRLGPTSTQEKHVCRLEDTPRL
ncbi:hypothetical protein V5O48_003247 [Marasmius crinis-equi]|uniref:Uncharacterized protein n=1 Tax=Marasmius crinis-equi TaxID=585013 RepID=A0ABR3FTF1_9AGAR